MLGRIIEYKRFTVEEQADFYSKYGLNPQFAKALAEMDRKIAEGNEEAVFNDPKTASEGRKFVGKHTLRQYFEDNKHFWIN